MRRYHLVLVALAGALSLSACSNDDDAAADDVVETPAVEQGEPLAADVNAPVDVSPEPADQDGETPAVEPEASAEPAADEPLNPVVDIRPLNDWYFAVVINQQALTDPAELEPIGREICQDLAPCRAAMWFNPQVAPNGFPVAERALREQAFAIGRTADGSENVLWNCNLFPQFEEERRCLPRLLQ